jgi:hypothetical protein
VAGRPARRPLLPPRQPRLPEPDAADVRGLRARAGVRLGAAVAGAGGSDRGRPRDPAAGAAAALPGRVRVPRLRAAGGATRARPLQPRPRRSACRRRVPVRWMAVQALPLRPPVHARQLCARPAGAGRRPLGPEDSGRRLESGGDRARGLRRPCAGALGQVAGGVRGAEPGIARAGRRRCPQRHARDGRAGAGARAGRPRAGPRPRPRVPVRRARGPRRWYRRAGRERRRGRGRGGGQDRRRRRAAVRGARSRPLAGALEGAGRGGAGAGRAGGRGPDRVRLAHARLPRRGRRAAAARGDPQRAGRDRPPGGAVGNADLVAAPLSGGLLRGTRVHAVANGTGLGLAGDGGLGDARAAGVHGLAAAVVRDLAAPASGPRRGPAADRRHAAVLRLRGPDPPAAG